MDSETLKGGFFGSWKNGRISCFLIKDDLTLRWRLGLFMVDFQYILPRIHAGVEDEKL